MDCGVPNVLEKAGTSPLEELGTTCGCLELGPDVRGLRSGPKQKESPLLCPDGESTSSQQSALNKGYFRETLV